MKIFILFFQKKKILSTIKNKLENNQSLSKRAPEKEKSCGYLDVNTQGEKYRWRSLRDFFEFPFIPSLTYLIVQ